MIVYISIGNSDDKLSQYLWAHFVADVENEIEIRDAQLHGAWFSRPDSEYQNACWCVEFENPETATNLKTYLTGIRIRYVQDSVAWAEVSGTEFV